MGVGAHKLFTGDDHMPIDINTKGLQFKISQEDIDKMTGWERVKKIFELDMYGAISPEIQRCKDTISYTFIIGAMVGGIGRSRIAYMDFFRNNMHTAFETPVVARKKLQEAVLIGFGSGAWRLGWRVAAFSALYSIATTAFTVYRGKSSVYDPAVGGAIAGFVYKFQQGPQFALAGTAVGGLLGLIGGGAAMIAMKSFGVSPDEVLAFNRQQIYDRRKAEAENAKALLDDPIRQIPHNSKIKKLHDELLKNELEIPPRPPEFDGEAPVVKVEVSYTTSQFQPQNQKSS